MFAKNFRNRRTRGLRPALALAGLALALGATAFAPPAQALPVTYWVSANATTGGYVGTSNVFTGALNNQSSAYIESDPAGQQFGSLPSQQLYADTGAHSWADTAELRAQVSSEAARINATSFPSSPTASSEGRFADTITVQGIGLPNGTPVTLTFRNAIDVDWQGSSLYDGYVSTSFSAGGYSASTRWDVAYNKPLVPVQSPAIQLKTTVGARLQLSGRLNTFARGSYFVPGPLYDGSLSLDVVATLRLESSTVPVTLVSDSGADYNPIGN